ncbi:MAG: SseB family protein [Pirellulales bacterium]|nr:SseB family protein [Pirellulales bacterium]
MADDEAPVAYTIVFSDNDEMATPLWVTDEGQQVLPVFSSEERAKLYLENAGMTEGLRPASMTLGDFFRWTVPAFEQGTVLAGVDWTGKEDEPVATDLEGVLRDTVEQLLAPIEP